MYFWPAVRDHLASGSTLADEATGQEQEAKHVLASLDKLSPDDAEFEQRPYPAASAHAALVGRTEGDRVRDAVTGRDN
jgi:hypothetical protein